MSTTISSTPKWTKTPSSGLQINSCAISDDGRRVVVGTSNERGTGQFAIYCYDEAGALLWSKPIGDQSWFQGVFWVAISADGSTCAAGGESADRGAGFLNVYAVEDGAPLMNQLTLPSRVNQVSLSADGSTLLACFGPTVALYAWSDVGFTQLATYSVTLGGINSAMLASQAPRVVLGSIHYETDHKTSGRIVALDIEDSGGNVTLTPHESEDFDAGVMRVAITADGSAWGGSLYDGSCVCFQTNATTSPAWHFRPVMAVELGYAFAITGSAAAGVKIAYGVNLPTGDDPGAPQGAVISIDSVGQSGDYDPVQRWIKKTTYAVNPGVSMDASGSLITATDGKPDPGHEKHESAGFFYLYNNVANTLLWSYHTSLMNWPMMVAANGEAVVGASDNGTVYYWSTG